MGGMRLVSTNTHLPTEQSNNRLSNDYYCEGCMSDVKEETILDRKTKLWLCKQCKKEMNNEGTSRD